MMHKSATVQAAVSSGRKIGQKLPRETNKKKKKKKRDRDKISSLLQTDNQGSNLEQQESRLAKILTLKPPNV